MWGKRSCVERHSRVERHACEEKHAQESSLTDSWQNRNSILSAASKPDVDFRNENQTEERLDEQEPHFRCSI